MTSETGNVRPISTALEGVWQVFSDLRMTLVLVVASLAVAALSTRQGTGLDTPVLRVLLALLAFNLLLQLALQVERAARLWSPRYPSPPASAASIELAPPGGEDGVRLRAETVWEERFSRVLRAGPPDEALYGARRRAGIAGPLAAVGGGLLFLVGLWFNAAVGWSEPDLMLNAGVATALPQRDGASLTFEEAAPGPAQPLIGLTGASGERRQTRIVPGRPARIGAVWLLASEGGPTLEASGRDGAGQPLQLQSAEPGVEPRRMLALAFPPAQAEQAFSVPAAGLVFRAVSYASLPERGAAGPVLLVEAYREGDAAPVADALVSRQAELSLDGATYLLRRGRYLDVSAAYLPGWPLLAVGALLAAGGLLVALLLGAREGWVSAVDRAVWTAGGLTPRRDARSLVDQLQVEGAPISAEQGDR